MRTLLTSAAAVLVLTLAAACGGDSGDSGDSADEKAAEPSPTGSTSAAAPGGGGLTVTDGITPDDLVGCLTDAGLTAAVSDSVPLGVEVPVVNVDVTEMTDYSGGTDQGAELFVFADPTNAADNAGVLTLGGSDDPTNQRFGVHQNVVRVMSIILAPDPHTDDEAALLACLPA